MLTGTPLMVQLSARQLPAPGCHTEQDHMPINKHALAFKRCCLCRASCNPPLLGLWIQQLPVVRHLPVSWVSHFCHIHTSCICFLSDRVPATFMYHGTLSCSIAWRSAARASCDAYYIHALECCLWHIMYPWVDRVGLIHRDSILLKGPILTSA